MQLKMDKKYIYHLKQTKKYKKNGEIISEGAGEKVLKENEENNKNTKININTAKQEKLEELPGIRKFNSYQNYYISRRTWKI